MGTIKTTTIFLVSALATGCAGRPRASEPPSPRAADTWVAGSEPDSKVGITPKVIYAPSPPYPLEARKTNLTGVVVVEIVVAGPGNVSRAEMLSGDPTFAEAALDTVRTWRYEPVVVSGRQIAWKSRVTFRFELPDPPEIATDLGATGLTPRGIDLPIPPFPQEARETKTNGVVVVEIIVSRMGEVVSARVLSGDSLFTESTLATVRRWKYEPLLMDGAPIVWKSKVTLRFKLEDPLPSDAPPPPDAVGPRTP